MMMLEERLLIFSEKHSLDSGDAIALLQLLQEQTAPILSLRSPGKVATTSDESSTKIHPGSYTAGRAARRRPARDGRRSTGAQLNSPRKDIGGGGERGGGRSGVSPKRALFDSDSGVGSLNVNSLVEFPPMAVSAATSKKKEKKSSKPRRITLTSVHGNPLTNQGLSSPAQFASHSTPMNDGGWISSSISSHPTFTCQTASTSSSSSTPLTEERKLLKEERSKHQQKTHKSRITYNKMEVLTERVEMTPRSEPLTLIKTTPLQHQSHSRSNTSTTEGAEIPRTFHLQSSSSPRDSTATYVTSTPGSSRPSLGLAPINVGLVTKKTSLDTLAQLHSVMINDGLVPNVISEIHFIVQLLTCTQPVTQSQHSSGGKSELIFVSVENAVYFAVQVLNQIRRFLSLLDSATLQLLNQNSRIKQFEPKLATYLSEALEGAKTEIQLNEGPHERQMLLEKRSFTHTVPFQEETDNIKNFPNMRVFHAFKKQRDHFYSILREWEANHNQPHWNYHSVLKDKIRSLIHQPDELWSLDHLANLFQKQLLESCGYAAHVSAVVGDLADTPLTTLNPGKLLKLSKRFQLQSSVKTGASPLPSFSDTEQFFSNFLSIADSHTFNCHLAAALSHELIKLHCRCETLTTREVPEVLHGLKVLAKFLGHLDFLPFSHSLSLSLQQGRTASPHVETVSKCIQEAKDKHHLSLTIPWTVDYLSMMDSHALQVPQYLSLLHQMVSIYRSCVTEKEVSMDTFLVLTSLGWLLETPNIPNSFFFEHLKSSEGRASPSFHLVQSELVSRDLLYICCPYLSNIRVTLAEFSSGFQSKTSPIKKIKPIPVDPHSSNVQSSQSSQLQMRLQENFFRNHPPLLRQLCDTVSERVSEAAVQLVQSQVVPEHVRRGVQSLARWISQSCLDQSNMESHVHLDNLFHKIESVRKLAQVSEQTYSTVVQESTHFCRKHCETNAYRAIRSLVSSTIPEQVLVVAIGLSTNLAIKRCGKWISTKLRGVVHEEVSGGFEKLRKAVRTGVRASHTSSRRCSSLTSSVTTTPDVSSHICGDENVSLSLLEKSSSSMSHRLMSVGSEKSAHINHCPAYIDHEGPRHSPSTETTAQSSHYSVESDVQVEQQNSASREIRGYSSQHYSIETDATEGGLTPTPLSPSIYPTTFTRGRTYGTETQETADSRTTIPHLMDLVKSIMAQRPPTKDTVEEVAGVIGRVREFLLSEVEVVEGGHSPHLLPNGTDSLLSTSVHLAALLVSWNVSTISISPHLTALWSLLKGLKKEVPIHLLMSRDSIHHYLYQTNQGIEGVWSSLTSLLMEVIDLNIVAVDVIEALWLCRIRQSTTAERQSVIDGSVVFLSSWYRGHHYSHKKDDVKSCSEDSNTFREVCFVRLLALVAQESDSPFIDTIRSTHPSLSLLHL